VQSLAAATCNIGYGGKEITVTDFELLARPVRQGTDPCKPLSDRLDTLNQEIDSLVEALASGEIPPPPRTPEKIAAVKAQIQDLRMQAGKVAKQLDQCRQQNP
jgi:hypothetical protein